MIFLSATVILLSLRRRPVHSVEEPVFLVLQPADGRILTLLTR